MPKGTIWSSLNPRSRTQLIFTGSRPHAGSANTSEHAIESVGHASDAGEEFRIDCIHADSDAIEARVFQRLGISSSKWPFVVIACRFLPATVRSFDRSRTKSTMPLRRKSSSSGQPDFRNSQTDEDTRHPQVIFKWQFRVEGAVGSSPAIDAT